MTRRVCIVGSTNLDITTSIGAEIVDLVRAYGDDIVLLTRGSGDIDTFIATIALPLGLRCLTYPSAGGADNWIRDVELVKDADEVLAIVSRKDLDKGRDSGTLHVVDKALDQEKSVRLYTVLDDGSLVGVASSDDREEA